MSSRQVGLDADHVDRKRRLSNRELLRWLDSSAAYRMTTQLEGVTTGTSSPSVPTCEKVPTSADDTEPSGGSTPTGGELPPDERDLLTTLWNLDVGEATIPELADAVRRGADARRALWAALERSDERQAKVVALVRNGEVAHARRLATCGRKSVQLECPDTIGAAGCGHDGNYIPITCDSRLCPDCGSRRQGQAVERYGDVVSEWDAPTMLRLGLDRRVDATEASLEAAVDELREAFGKLRRRVVPPSGSHQGKRWVWSRDAGVPADHYWKASLQREASRRARENGDRSLFAQIERWEREFVNQGRGIPMDELLEAGVYGIDAKQSPEDETVHVHLHVLADVTYVPQAALASLWDDLTDAPAVDVRRVDERGESDRETALMETVGYAAKPPEYETLAGAVAYLKALKGTKMIQPFGELHGNTPKLTARLLCQKCDNSPAWWNYVGMVDERRETVSASWTSGDGTPPPPDETA